MRAPRAPHPAADVRAQTVAACRPESAKAVLEAGDRGRAVDASKPTVSAVASGDVSGCVEICDIATTFPMTDIAGLNRLSRTILAGGDGQGRS